ncbi:ABC transporter ATP-binding protein [Kutzneria sp. 744]|uniref:ABC transporter ATP-binding protein n=1 Tax=Kutzneria sp. (strain 744) TaxID=345341 RepID=UPI0003EEC8B4|nr:ABC transporter ATP-binding protein [Kutzneria sp. 744]EWM15828.1 ABC transporter ATP-binding protein [Kutzneria sp. 744]
MTDGLALAAHGLGKRYRATWALRDCSFELPEGRVAALVGTNGAGKTTLLTMIAGLLQPTEGEVRLPRGGRVAFVAQDKPLYRNFTPLDMLRVGAKLNRQWDQGRAIDWLTRFDVPPGRPCGKLSGGQQAQVAFAVAVGSRPSLLVLDEPLSDLDPLARRAVINELLTEVADTGMTMVMSTHVVAELSGVADHLLLLADGALLMSGDVDDLLAEHRVYIGPRSPEPPVPGRIVQASHAGGQSTFVLQGDAPVDEPWTVRPATLEEVVLARLSAGWTVAA